MHAVVSFSFRVSLVLHSVFVYGSLLCVGRAIFIFSFGPLELSRGNKTKMYRNKNAPPPSDEEHEKMVDDIMQKEDKDKDGKISHAEFSGPKSPKTEL